MEETGNKLHLFVSAASSTSHNQNWWRMKFLCREMQQLPWFVDCTGIQAVLQPSPPPPTKISVLQCCRSKFPFQVPKYPHRSLSSAVLTSHSGAGSIFWFDPISCSSPASQSLPMHPLDCRACPWQNPVRLYLLMFLSASPLVKWCYSPSPLHENHRTSRVSSFTLVAFKICLSLLAEKPQLLWDTY